VKYVDEYRDAELGRVLAGEIVATVEPGREYKIMEVCGGHTHTIYKYGVDDLLPANVELVHGPGCPVCVIPMGRVDDGIAVAHIPGVIFTCFGDMMRVPGGSGTLLDAKAQGADVRMVYSPLDALRIARENPDREVVFFAVGFETTAPSTALTLKRAKAEGIRNFSCFSNHVTIVPPLRALLESPDLRLDGFIGPGHVSTVVGARPFEFIPADYGKPVVISGFEPLDLLQSSNARALDRGCHRRDRRAACGRQSGHGRPRSRRAHAAGRPRLARVLFRDGRARLRLCRRTARARRRAGRSPLRGLRARVGARGAAVLVPGMRRRRRRDGAW